MSAHSGQDAALLISLHSSSTTTHPTKPRSASIFAALPTSNNDYTLSAPIPLEVYPGICSINRDALSINIIDLCYNNVESSNAPIDAEEARGETRHAESEPSALIGHTRTPTMRDRLFTFLCTMSKDQLVVIGKNQNIQRRLPKKEHVSKLFDLLCHDENSINLTAFGTLEAEFENRCTHAALAIQV